MEIFLNGVIGWDVYAQDIRDKLKEANGADIKMLISSPGGFISEGLAIANLMRSYSGRIEVEISGEAASMATYIAMFADKVSVYDNSVFMIHNALGGVMGDYREIGKYGNMLESFTKMLARAYVQKTNKCDKDIRKMMDDETYMFGAEIKELGFADEIISSGDELDEDMKAEKFSETMLNVNNAKDIIKKIGQKEDFEQAAAMLGTMPVNKSKTAEAVENTKGVKMTLEEFLASSTDAKMEFDQKISDAKKSGAEEAKARIDSAAKFMGGTYPDRIKEMALSAMKGEKSLESLTDAVALYDEMIENSKSLVAKNEQAEMENTIAQTQKPVSADGVVRNQEDYMAAVAMQKKAMGLEVK